MYIHSISKCQSHSRSGRGRDRMVVGFITTYATDVESSNPAQGEVYNIMW